MKYKLFFLSIGLFFIVIESRSQTAEKYCLHYPYNTQVGISLNTNLLSKMQIVPNHRVSSPPPSEYLRSSPSLGAGLGVYLYQRVYKWFGIQVGVEYSHITVCYGGTANSTELFRSISMKYFTEMFTFPILFNASYYFNEQHGLNVSLAPFMLLVASAPVRGGYHLSNDNHTGDGNYYWFELDDYLHYNLSFYAKIGYNFLFKNKNTMGIDIVGSYAAAPYARGNYSFIMDGKDVEGGSVSLHNTYIGLQFSFGFTMKKLLCIPSE